MTLISFFSQLTGHDCLPVDTEVRMEDLVCSDGKHYYGSKFQPFYVMTPDLAARKRHSHVLWRFMAKVFVCCVTAAAMAFVVYNPDNLWVPLLVNFGAFESLTSHWDDYPKEYLGRSKVVVNFWHKLPIEKQPPNNVVEQTKKEQ